MMMHAMQPGQVAYGHPVTAPVAMPTAGMVLPQHMGVRAIPGAPVTLSSAPITMASAPVTMPSAPVTMHMAGVAIAAPTVIHHAAAPTHNVLVHPGMGQVIPSNLLASGQVIHSGPIHREELLAQGRLIPDLEKEHALMTQASQIPGALLGPNANISVQPIQHHSIVHHEHAIVHAQQPHMFHQEPVVVQDAGAPPPESLEVSILQANNLANLHKFTGDSMVVICEVVHRTGNVMAHGHIPTLQSNQADKAQSPDPLNPVWNECHVLEGFFPGDSLQFTIHDRGLNGGEVTGVTHMDTEHFYTQEGFEGELAVDNRQDATLSVRIRPLGPIDQQQLQQA